MSLQVCRKCIALLLESPVKIANTFVAYAPSVVFHSDDILSRITLAQRTLARMSSAVLPDIFDQCNRIVPEDVADVFF